MKLYQKDGRVSSLNNIVLIRDGMQVINPTEEMVLADGWTEYVPEPYVPQPKLEPYEYEVTAALRMMTHRMTIASGNPSPSIQYMANENSMAMKRMITITSESCSAIIFHMLFVFTSRKTFLPYFASLFAASSSESPSSLVCKISSAS